MDIHVLAASVLSELREAAFMRAEFPMLTKWGCPSDTVHSVGLNYLTALGRQNGFWAVSEYPVQNITNINVSRAVRCDIAWFSKPSGEVKLLCEFERYDSCSAGRAKLKEKAENLVIAHHQLPSAPRVLLLLVWAVAGSVITGLQELVSTVRQGFRDEIGNLIPSLSQDSMFRVATFILRQSHCGMIFEEALL